MKHTAVTYSLNKWSLNNIRVHLYLFGIVILVHGYKLDEMYRQLHLR